MSDSIEKKGLRLDTSVNVGTIVQSASVICLALWFIVGKANTADQAGLDLKAFRAEVALQFADLKSQVASLPNERAAAQQVERRISEASAQLGRDGERIGKLEQSVYELKTDLAAIRSASAIPLRKP